MSTTLVLGVGNTLLSDEGAGLHALMHLQRHYFSLPNVQYLDGGTLSFTLAGPVQDADNLIVLDAANFAANPGTVRCLVGAQMDRFLGAGKRSAHEVGLLDLLDIARLTDSLPAKRALVGIQPEVIEWGSTLSRAVEDSIDRAVNKTLTLIEEWTKADISAPS